MLELATTSKYVPIFIPVKRHTNNGNIFNTNDTFFHFSMCSVVYWRKVWTDFSTTSRSNQAIAATIVSIIKKWSSCPTTSPSFSFCHRRSQFAILKQARYLIFFSPALNRNMKDRIHLIWICVLFPVKIVCFHQYLFILVNSTILSSCCASEDIFANSGSTNQT